MRQTILIDKTKEKALIEQCKTDPSAWAQRIVRLYELPNLALVEGNPVHLVVQKILSLPTYQDFDLIDVPEVVNTEMLFDRFNFPMDHPARTRNDSYFLNDEYLLRPHTTVMRPYYLDTPGVREKLKKEGEIKVISYGKVYRRDEIDARHYMVFHNIDALYICKKSLRQVGGADLEEKYRELAAGIYGADKKITIVEDKNPYTLPTLEVEIDLEGRAVEVFSGGVLRPETLELLGLDPEMYNGRAMGPGIERIAMIKMEIPDIRILWSQDPRILAQWGDLDHKYLPVSKYPSTYRDISFIIDKSVSLNDYYDLVRDLGGDRVEEVTLLDTYENEQKFGPTKKSYTRRIVRRSHERTLENDEVNNLQFKIRKATEEILGAELR